MRKINIENEWTPQDIKKLEELYVQPNLIFEEIMKEFPNRTEQAVRSKASRMKIRRPIILYEPIGDDPVAIKSI